MLDKYLNWFKLLSNIFYEKNVGPTWSSIVCKRIQHFLYSMSDDVGPTCWTRFPWPQTKWRMQVWHILIVWIVKFVKNSILCCYKKTNITFLWRLVIKYSYICFSTIGFLGLLTLLWSTLCHVFHDINHRVFFKWSIIFGVSKSQPHLQISY